MTKIPLISSILILCLLTPSLSVDSASDEDRAQTAAGTGSSDGVGTDRVYLRSITALIFSENGRTASNFGPGKPELRCVGGSAAGFWWFTDIYPHKVQCKNIGWDGASIQWGCEAALGQYVEFGAETQVVCEPYDENDPNDGYVLRGSCRLEYTLNFKTFHVSFVHVIYGCILAIGLLWCYYQSRFLIHRFLKERYARIAAAKAQQSGY
eukprot:GFKZ01010631.1.p1 GENE.GFKZ01010631.1~~GFKZ01010631.1.p1  ORF type:complete len:209 (+),score=10.08 GFKZ01010631.1:90-716(+)